VHAQAPPPQPTAEPGAKCPGCGRDVDRDQPFCLSCGRRLALDYRRPPNWRIPLALIALLVIAAGTAAGLGITRLTGTDERGPQAITVTTGTSEATTPPAAAATTAPPAQTAPAPAPPAGEAPGWPAGTKAYTVVLLTTKSKDTADATAKKAVAAGLPAGVIKSDDFARFEPGLYVVYSGQYDSVDAATSEARRAGASNPGAYARYIEPKTR
jgi:predicted nucleic acid-binding Zn ribbon protein